MKRVEHAEWRARDASSRRASSSRISLLFKHEVLFVWSVGLLIEQKEKECRDETGQGEGNAPGHRCLSKRGNVHGEN